MSERFPYSEICSRREISDYYEGELSRQDETRVEWHLAECGECAEYLNSLKLVSTSLEIFLENETVPIPKQFSKAVKAAAENDTEGIRSPKERYRAVVVTALLFCFAAVLLSADASAMAPAVSEFSGGIIAAGGLLGHFVYTLSLAVSFVAGAFCSSFLYSSAFVALTVFSLLAFCLFFFSKHIAHSNR
jgi:anti-sigma factor RsiW